MRQIQEDVVNPGAGVCIAVPCTPEAAIEDHSLLPPLGPSCGLVADASLWARGNTVRSPEQLAVGGLWLLELTLPGFLSLGSQPSQNQIRGLLCP